MTITEIEEVFSELEALSDKKSSIVTKRFSSGIHTYFLSSEQKVPIFLIQCDQLEADSITRLSMDSLQLFVRTLSIEGAKESSYLVISLRRLEHAALFFRVIESLLYDFSRKSGDTFTLCALNLKRWKSFWDNKLNRGLSEEQIIGLFGELFFLKNIYDLTKKFVVDRWTGPLGSEHDFIFSSSDFEIKATTGKIGSITVSSLRQLEISDNKKLFLVLVELGEGVSKLSLKDLVYYLDSKADPEEQGLFWRKLTKLGYRLDEESRYESVAFDVSSFSIFEVKGDFPRIINPSFIKPVDSRIRNLRYEVELKELEQYVIDDVNSCLKDFGC